jgi:hypothetical protein
VTGTEPEITMDTELLDDWDREAGHTQRQRWSWHVDLLESRGKVEIIRDGLTIAETYSVRNAEQIVSLLNKADSY